MKDYGIYCFLVAGDDDDGDDDGGDDDYFPTGLFPHRMSRTVEPCQIHVIFS